ncbi:ferritin-like domain-containing protein [Sphingomonas sp. VNH70]|uniref:ferritin-like domain-containing protein n=1 Tax=Sphingomonas silueang TaxID=3156617 RepID=UPI0032B41801
MTEGALVAEAFDARAKRREDRRDFFRMMGGAAAIGGAAMLAGQSGPAAAQSAFADSDVLNFALNLEYLEAQFYYYAAFGTGLPNSILTGTGTQGAVTGGRQVAFSDPLVGQYAREIAQDERAHVEFLRTALGSAAVAQPAIDIGVGVNSAFSNAARAAGLVNASTAFDPYASDEAFLLGAFIFEDVGVTAYKGAAPLLTNKTFLEAAAGILAVEAYHAAIVRTTLYAKGIATPSANLIAATDQISNARDSLDGTSDIDQGLSPLSSNPNASNIVPLDANGIAYSRTTAQVLNIAYLNRAQVNGGGFFPNGVNGLFRSSGAN